MRDSWYADKRDLVKWGTLAHIAEREHLPLIVQVPYPRVGSRPRLQNGGKEVPIQPAVWDFFRNLSGVEHLGKGIGRQIVVIPDIFDPQRRQRYNQTVVDRLRALSTQKVVLLDPDTGLAAGKPAAEHVTPADVQAVWNAINQGDWLVLYQHASRTKTWRTDARRRFTAICCVQECEEFNAPDISADVVFFAVKKA
jgi:hypothetical protein